MRRSLTQIGKMCLPGFAVAVLNVIAWQLHFNLASASVLQVVVVVLAAREFGFAAATVGSFVAVLCLNYFFIPPVLTFVIADPQNLVALLAFEACALLVSRLSAKANQRALDAQQKSDQLERLYEVSRQMLLLDRRRAPGPQIVDLFQRELDCAAVGLFDGDLAQFDWTGDLTADLETRIRSAYLTRESLHPVDDNTWIRTLRLGAQTRGAIGLRGRNLSPLMVDALASLAAVGLERARSFAAESRAMAEAHTEQLRTAVLDSLAHDFKTPLTVIRTASEGLMALASLSPEFHEMASMIDSQAVGLDEMTTRLLRTAKLEEGEIAARRQRITLPELRTAIRDTAARLAPDRQVTISLGDESVAVYIDPGLVTMAMAQILDNAVRYSIPESPIAITGDTTETDVTIRVTNLGDQIAPELRERIFERYYRIPGSSRRANGTGLGLSVTKKIIDAHNGRVWVTCENSATTFCVALPRDHHIEHES